MSQCPVPAAPMELPALVLPADLEISDSQLDEWHRAIQEAMSGPVRYVVLSRLNGA